MPARPATSPQDRQDVDVRRSARRRRTVSAYRERDRIVVLIPDSFSAVEEEEWVATMVRRISAPPARRGDEDLLARAGRLSERYLDGLARPASVRWAAAMRSRWGSCTSADATIRLSGRLRHLPGWVQDYVLLHELAHLLEPGHGPEFWAWVQRYPRAERARGFLEGVTAAADLPPER